MKRSSVSLASVAAAALTLAAPLSLSAPALAGTRPGPAAGAASGSGADAAPGSAIGSTADRARRPPDGEAIFRHLCAGCHLGLAQTGGIAASLPPAGTGLGHAIPRELLHTYPPEAILNALTNGKMQAQGAALTAAERRAVAAFASGRAFGAKPADPAIEAGKPCAGPAPRFDPERGPRWNGWGNGVTNTRYQPRSRGGLTAADLPRLRLAWAFGFVNVASVRSQPAVAGGRLFVASENGQVHALDARTGCTYWTFTAQAGVGTALSIGPYRHGAAGARRYAVYFGDRRANAYAVDAESGQPIWVRKVDPHRFASITGSPTVFRGRVFVPVQGIGEEGQAGRGDYACCTFRGSVSALDASTGALIWKTYTVAQSGPRGKRSDGAALYGPAGGGIWSAPTIDARRGLVYVATGNGYAEPAQRTTDAVIALDLRTGAVRWVRQALADDVWVMGCQPHNPALSACPPTLGPDYDFSASPALTRAGSRDMLVLPQKSGLAYALDPDDGRILWRYRIGAGSGLGGEWGGAIEGGVAYFGVADLLTRTPGGVQAVRLADGSRVWRDPPPRALCGDHLGCSVGQGAALTAIPGAVLSGALDGGLRAYSTRDGSLLWMFDCNRDLKTVNGVRAHGGGIDGPGPIVAGGMVYANCGNGGLVGIPGNALVAFSLPTRR